MSDASRDLIQAVFSALSSDPDLTAALGAAKIFDQIPERSALPYVVLGLVTTTDWSTATEDGDAVEFSLHIWSQAKGRAEVMHIQSGIEKVLKAESFSLQDHRLIQLRNQFSETRRDGATGNLHGLLRFRATVEPVS